MQNTLKATPMFHENWYPEDQIVFLKTCVMRVKNLEGHILEVGCWEGKSTIAIAQAAAPDDVIAIDTWEGSTDESPEHATVQIAKVRDVFSTFRDNVWNAGVRNIQPARTTWQAFFKNWDAPIKLLHIDGSHDYRSVRDNICVALPFMVKGGIICGDDILTAHAGRADLEGGVGRAVSELLPGYVQRGNFWEWQQQ